MFKYTYKYLLRGKQLLFENLQYYNFNFKKSQNLIIPSSLNKVRSTLLKLKNVD